MIRFKSLKFYPNAKSIYSVFVALIPVLSPYASFINGVFLEEFLLIIMTVISVIYKKNDNPKCKLIPIYVLSLEIIFSVILNLLLSYGQTTDVLVRSIRMLFYLTCISFTSKRLLDLNKTMNAITVISIYSVFFIIIQVILYRTTGYFLKGVGNFLPLAYNVNYDYQYIMSIMYRPAAIFTEPAMMSEYLMVPLAYHLLGNKSITKHSIIIASILTLGVFLTTSLWGIIIIILIWSIWLLKVAVFNKYFIFLIVAIAIVGYFVFNSYYFSSTMSRIDINSFDSIMNSDSFSGRFMGYDSLRDLTFFQKLFGLGFGNLGIRSQIGTGNSIVYYLLGLGFAGTIIFYTSCILSLKFYNTLWQKTIFILMLLLSFGAGTINTCLIMYFFIVSVYTYCSDDENTYESVVLE